ncbi:MAG: 4-hydroxythreonine-4-phosphate dehydrogenase [Campylobacteraceae bacterium]|jgi:4-hydroxythreonine-4-phosphate dehydrogenase|nr:4-hydroxythreonine-4-phosphate dehydrogenase [Campylobacteraceae bacterium]
MKKIAVSIGDLNGIGLEIALRAHEEVKTLCEPIYCINETMLQWGAALLGLNVPMDFNTVECAEEFFEITPGIVSEKAGKASFDSFVTAVALAKSNNADAIVTLPINKEAWSRADIVYKGHTDALEDMTGSDAIMMLGCDKLFTILFTHHIPLKDVSEHIKTKALTRFLLQTYESLKVKNIGVLGFNPHAGDGGVLGDEEIKITKAIARANDELDKNVFFGPLVPDAAFTPKSLERCAHFVCMYHDQGLIPLKALYFEESINVTLNLPLIRTSVDHGTAFDIAYKDKNPSLKSYINAVKEAVRLSDKMPVLDF